jgi:hypothetical protein
LSPLDPGGTGQACLLLPFGRLIVRVKQDETLVYHIQIVRYALIVLVELLQNLLGFLLWEVDQETLGRLDIIGCDVNLLIVRRYLHNVVSLTKIFAALIKNKPVFVEILSLTDHRKQVMSTVNAS